jgi:hypothetical protein
MLAVIKTWLATALTAAVFLFSGCSQPQNAPGNDATAAKPTEAAVPSGPVTAKTAYLPLYKSAFKWSPDVVLLGMTAKEMPGLGNTGGRAALWEATFASPAKHTYRIFTYAIAAHQPDISKGINVGHAIPWGGFTRDVLAVPAADFNVDSDAASTTAAADAATWLKKNPGTQLTSFQLGNGYSFPSPVWYVTWGDKKSGYVAIVNATNGNILKKK